MHQVPRGGLPALRDHDPFEIVLAHLGESVLVILRGNLDYRATIEHHDTLRALTGLRIPVALDLADMQFIDSAGLRFLIQLANAQGARVRLENVPPPIARVVGITGIADMFDFDGADAQ